jgi:hypothetical protein
MTHTSKTTVTQVVLERVRLVDAELEYEVRGAGEPVVLVHNGVLADWFRPLLDQPALAGYRLVRYHRAGYAGSPLLAGSLGLADHARHCRGLLDHLGIERAMLSVTRPAGTSPCSSRSTSPTGSRPSPCSKRRC